MCLDSRPGFEVVGHVTNVRDLFDLCRLRQPDIVAFDAGADIGTVTRILDDLKERYPGLRLVVAYDQLTRAGITAAARLGIDALVPHSHGLDALLAALQQQAEALRSEPPKLGTGDSSLTPREREILTLLSAGHTAERVADLLRISACAVDNVKRRIYRKMRVTNQSHAIARAATLGLIDRPADQPPDRRALALARSAESGASLRVTVLGPDTLIRHRVAVTLLKCHVPFVMGGPSAEPAFGWNGRTLDPVVGVLADPGPDDWTALDDVDVPVLLVRARRMSRGDAMAALGRGVVAMIDAEQLEQNLVPALQLASSGHLTISPVLADAVVAGIRARSDAPEIARPELTPREREILESIASGHTVRQTARSLGIAQKTVENIQARLFRKLGVRNRPGAVASAYSLGLLDPDAQQFWQRSRTGA